MQLRYKKKATLELSEMVKQSNGVKVATYNEISKWTICTQEINDEVSVTMYGADINSIIRITSIKNGLEDYLKDKVSNKSDNVSKYYISINGIRYKIRAVREKWIDIERL